MTSKRPLLILAALIATAAGQASNTSVGATVPRCAPAGVGDEVTKWKPTFVCLTVADQRAVFTPQADVFSSLESTGSYKRFKSSANPLIELHVSSLGATSLVMPAGDGGRGAALAGGEKLYIDVDSNGNQVVYPLYTAIVHVVQGKASYVTFDEGCFLGCDDTGTGARGGTCGANSKDAAADPHQMRSCYMTAAECQDVPTADSPDANTCDLKLFVVWTGTDASGQFFVSSGKRFSRFRSFPVGVQSLWNSIKNAAATAVQGLQRE